MLLLLGLDPTRTRSLKAFWSHILGSSSFLIHSSDT